MPFSIPFDRPSEATAARIAQRELQDHYDRRGELIAQKQREADALRHKIAHAQTANGWFREALNRLQQDSAAIQLQLQPPVDLPQEAQLDLQLQFGLASLPMPEEQLVVVDDDDDDAYDEPADTDDDYDNESATEADFEEEILHELAVRNYQARTLLDQAAAEDKSDVPLFEQNVLALVEDPEDRHLTVRHDATDDDDDDDDSIAAQSHTQSTIADHIMDTWKQSLITLWRTHEEAFTSTTELTQWILVAMEELERNPALMHPDDRQLHAMLSDLIAGFRLTLAQNPAHPLAKVYFPSKISMEDIFPEHFRKRDRDEKLARLFAGRR